MPSGLITGEPTVFTLYQSLVSKARFGEADCGAWPAIGLTARRSATATSAARKGSTDRIEKGLLIGPDVTTGDARSGLLQFPSIVRWFTRERFAYLAVYAALSVMFCWPLFAQPYAGGTGDWDQHTFYYVSVFHSLAHGQLPFWNPWYCGGNVLWQNPQVSLVSPVYLLALVMPFTLAMKLNVVLHYLAGCVGMHLVVRRIAGVRSPAIVVYAVALFVFSGGMALHIRTGHVNFLPVFLLPALVYCFYRGIAGHVHSLIAGGVIAGFAALNGGAHVVPLAAILLGSLGLGAIVAGRTLRPLWVAVLIVLGGCAFAAPKLVPAAMFITSADFQDRRPVKHPDFMPFDLMRRALADGSQGTDLKVPGGVQKYGWHEYGNYMGWFGIGLSVVAAVWMLAFAWRRERWHDASAAIALVVVVLVAAGEFPWAPAALLRSLPGFSNFRIPSRNILLVPLVGALCLAFATRLWQDRTGSRGVLRVLEVICLVGTLQLVLVNREAYRDVFIVPMDDTEARLTEAITPVVADREPPGAALSRLGENSNFMRSMAEGVSSLSCYEQLIVKRIARPGPATISGEATAVISDAVFTPQSSHRARPDGSRGRAGRAESEISRMAGRRMWDRSSAIRKADAHPPFCPAGFDGIVAFSFAPPGFWPGLTIWFIAVAASLVIWRRSAR